MVEDETHRRMRIEPSDAWGKALHAIAHLLNPQISTQDEFFRQLLHTFQLLKLRGFVTLLSSDGMLSVQAHGLSHSLIDTLRRFIHQDFIGYRFDPAAARAYQQVLATGKSQYVRDRTDALEGMLPIPLPVVGSRLQGLMGEGQIIVSPLGDAGNVIGTMTIIADWLTPADVDDADTFARIVTAALVRIREKESMDACLRRENLRNQVIHTLAGEHILPRALDHILHLTAQTIHADAAAMSLLDATTGDLHIPHHQHLPECLLQQTMPLADDPLSRAISERKTILLNPMRADRKTPARWIRAGVKGFLAIPLLAGEEKLGALVFCLIGHDRGFSDDEVQLAQSIASLMSITVWNEQLHSRAQERAQESQGLIQTAKSISSSLDQETVLHEIAQQAKNLLNADGSRIHLFRPDRSSLRCVLALGPYADALMSHPIMPGEGLTGTTAMRGEAILVNDLSKHPEHLIIPGMPWDRDEYLALAPMSIRQQVMGTMTVTRTSDKQRFLPQDLELLKAFAAHAAIALENANLYTEIASQASHLESEVDARTRELTISENRYRALVETSLAGIVQLDMKTQITYANQVLADLVGGDLDQLINRKIAQTNILTADSLDVVLQRFRERMDGTRPPQDVYEIELQHRSGHLISALIAVSMLRDGEGKPNGVTALILDISDRKLLEAELRAERDRLDALLNNIGDAVVVTDPEGYIEYVNPAWERQNQYQREDVIGKKPSIIRSGKHPPEFYREMWDAILAGRSWRGEVVNVRRDGELYDTSLIITPMMSDEGKLISIVGVQHDISSLKEVDRLKTEFVSDVSHELRTPLTNIRLYLELLSSTEDADRREMYTNTLFRESGRLAVIIEDLLALSRQDAGAAPFAPIDFNLDQMLAELVEDRAPLAQQRHLTLNYEPDPSVRRAYGDPQQLIQVFSNLLTNAMNYTQEEGQILIQTRRDEDDPDWIQVDVIDNGLGIKPDEKEKVFQRFYRGSASKQTGADGTGLGLSICEDIIRKHNGRISVHSEGQGKGATFSVRLPLRAIDSPTP